MSQVDRDARLPLYHQLYEVLHEKILLKEWKPGDRLPTETELTELYKGTRMTGRRVSDRPLTGSLSKHQEGCALRGGRALT